MTLSATVVGTQGTGGTVNLLVTASATGGAGRIVLVVATETNAGTATTVASISGLGGTWVKRASAANVAVTGGQAVEEWYADFAASVSGNIAITMNSAPDAAVSAAIFMSSNIPGGVPIEFDPNASVPVTSADNGPSEGNVFTQSAIPYILLIGALTLPGTFGTPNPTAATFTLLVNMSHSGAVQEGLTVYGGPYNQPTQMMSNIGTGFGSYTGSPTMIFDVVTEPITTGNFLPLIEPPEIA